MMLVADPQLVDPHTYPGRPWPLSSLTIAYTDLYMWRVFSLSTHELNPQTTAFLGDLFDGGREWGTDKSESPEDRWHKYGEQYWLKEYERFAEIFWKPWSEWQAKTGEGRHKLLASLPGNHDLGFAAGIQKPVRKRFNAYFGDGNRIDVIGNHTIVSLDTVSLSAIETDADVDVWKPAEDFLKETYKARIRAVRRALEHPDAKYKHAVVDSKDLPKSPLPEPPTGAADLPLILLTHVPLYRDPGTPCGPLREKYPPQQASDGHDPLAKDERNAIKVAYGYQYQNVLSADVSQMIVKALGTVRYVFSGDDHDYCEIVHKGYTSPGGGIREITVKSTSWAMGVRKPGFLLVSLWNPVDARGQSLNSGEPTMQTHLCLMPDQLGIFMRYGMLFALTLILLAGRALVVVDPSKVGLSQADDLTLPLHADEKQSGGHLDSSIHSSSTYGDMTYLSTRTTTSARPRSVSPQVYDFSSSSNGSGGDKKAPLIAQAGYYGPPERTAAPKPKKTRAPLSRWNLVAAELGRSVLTVGAVASLWYWWLLRHG